MSTIDINLEVSGPWAFKTSAPQTPDGSGLLVWTLDQPHEVQLATATTLRGFELDYADGSELLVGPDDVWSLLVRAQTTATVAHDDPAVAVGKRIITTTGANVVLTPAPMRLRCRYDGAAWAWYLEP